MTQDKAIKLQEVGRLLEEVFPQRKIKIKVEQSEKELELFYSFKKQKDTIWDTDIKRMKKEKIIPYIFLSLIHNRKLDICK